MDTTLPPSGPATTIDDFWAAPTVFRSDLYADSTVLVSGGGSGIGRAIALLFARLGARVVICGRTAEKLETVVAHARERGATMLGVTANIREPDQVRALFERCEAEFGLPDILVNNAGGQFARPAIDFSVNGWNAVIAGNLNGTWYMMQAAAQRWRDAARAGSIVNIVAPTERGLPGIAPTVAARAGVIGVSRTGRTRSPASSAAMVPKGSGTKGGRKRVVPTASGGSPRSAAIRRRPLTLDVLPWSTAMPSVV